MVKEKAEIKQIEFSKTILIIVMIFSFIMMIGCTLAKIFMDIEVIAYLGIFASMLASAYGFYYNKAKAENVVKIERSINDNSNISVSEFLKKISDEFKKTPTLPSNTNILATNNMLNSITKVD